jgi:asparagine synthase (glutamine-hydrolysing)
MCGICGIVDSAGRTQDGASLRQLSTALAHRGPDGDGFYEHVGVGLASRRLAIIDVAGGDQPIYNEDRSVAIVYNGESYNYPDLRQQLEKSGHQFRSNTDTECVVHL